MNENPSKSSFVLTGTCWGEITYMYISFNRDRIKNILLFSPIHFNFFLKYVRVAAVLLTWKVSTGFIRRYKNYKQITFMRFIILFLIKKWRDLFNVYECVLCVIENLISHRLITKIRLCPGWFARKTFFSLWKNWKKK